LLHAVVGLLVPAEPELPPFALPPLVLLAPDLLPLEPWPPGLSSCPVHAKTAAESSNAAGREPRRSSVVEFSAICALTPYFSA
jgi:hypothetical protein